MAMHCDKCGGIIPDVAIGGNKDTSDCKNHTKREVNIKIKHPPLS